MLREYKNQKSFTQILKYQEVFSLDIENKVTYTIYNTDCGHCATYNSQDTHGQIVK